jgi:hypothetical protein
MGSGIKGIYYIGSSGGQLLEGRTIFRREI